jgi:predicted NAD/FAD-binding protein
MLRAGGEATMQEEKALGSWSWSKNEAVLHWDERVGRRSSVSSE